MNQQPLQSTAHVLKTNLPSWNIHWNDHDLGFVLFEPKTKRTLKVSPKPEEEIHLKLSTGVSLLDWRELKVFDWLINQSRWQEFLYYTLDDDSNLYLNIDLSINRLPKVYPMIISRLFGEIETLTQTLDLLNQIATKSLKAGQPLDFLKHTATFVTDYTT